MDRVINPHADETIPARAFKNFAILTLSAANNRSQNLNFGILLHTKHRIDNLLNGLPLDRFAAVVAVRFADPCKQQSQVVVNFSNCSNG